MKNPPSRVSIRALKNLIAETDLIFSTSEPLPENRTPRCREPLSAALALIDDLQKQERIAPAAILGHNRGSTMARKHGPEHYRQMTAMRKIHGGRPYKDAH